MPTVRVTGGHKLKRKLAELQRAARQVDQMVIEVGFMGNVAQFAAQLEYGVPSIKLPERPAFRLGIPEAAKAIHDHVLKHGMPKSPNDLHGPAIAARDAIRRSYLDYHGPGLSQRQIGRKEGTPYADDELIGERGPRLISHIHAYINGIQVD